MKTTKEIKALLHLIDDPDVEVYQTVASKILDYGKAIIPELEHLWESTIDEDVQYRIEHLIHRALFADLQQEFVQWSKEEKPSLLAGGLLLAKYRYPELDATKYLKLFEQMRRNIWLELNAYLTPLEQVNVLNSILYNYYKLVGKEITKRDVNLFMLNQLLDTKQGNAYSIGILYLALSELLDLPIKAVGIPKQFVLAYFDTQFHFATPDTQPIETLQFYIDPVNGMVYTQNDVEVYLKKLNEGRHDYFFQALNNKQIMVRLLEELALTFDNTKEYDKSEEMHQLIAVIKEA
jgi:regulator of sirC expression with transglutaminase-like and TPR domain